MNKKLTNIKLTSKIGFWSALISAIMAILWFIFFGLKDVFWPMPAWTDTIAYLQAFSIQRVFFVYPSLILAISYLILLACIHQLLPKNKKLWSLIALATGTVYASMASINYNIQVVSVRMSLAAGQTAGLEMFLPDNPNSIFTALGNSYVYHAISLFFLGFAFNKQGRSKWISWLLLAQLITALGQIAWSMFDLNFNLFFITSLVWIIGAPTAFVLMALEFRQEEIF